MVSPLGIMLCTYLRGEHLLLAGGPGLVDVGLVLELLGEMFKSLKSHQLGQEPLLEGLLGGEKSVPGSLDVRDELTLGGKVGGSVGQPQLGLQGVEVGLQFGLLLHPGRLVLPPVLAVLLQLLLDGHQGVPALAGLQPWQSPSDPLQEVAGESLVLLHQPLVVLVHLQHFADPVGGHFSLEKKCG